MRLPIQFALTCPQRRYLEGERLDFARLGTLNFYAPDPENFPALPLAYAAGRKGGNAPTIYNAANEWAVARFLDGKLSYPGILQAIEEAFVSVKYRKNPTVDEILETEREVYEFLSGDGFHS